jgi:uncharacterized protein (TIGR02145 family)
MKKNIWNFLIVIVFALIALPTLAQQNETGTFRDDRDNKTYKWVKIGTQIWMAENLNYNCYAGTWCPNNNGALCSAYGRIYNFRSAQSVCPIGWHLPSKDEWLLLIDELGGEKIAGGKAKSVDGWEIPNVGATNESGFTALPGGGRFSKNDTYDEVGRRALWWSSDNGYTIQIFTVASSGEGFGFWFMEPDLGDYYVRCIKNN